MLPLIDIVFLLLVFFIYAMLSMVVHRGLRVELPAAATAQVSKSEFLSITITKDNAIYLDEEAVSAGELAARVLGRIRASETMDMPVFISGDSRSDLGVAIEILDLLREMNVREVSFECTLDER